LVEIQQEISVIVARNAKGDISTFPTVAMLFDPEANLVDRLESPASISVEIEEKAASLAVQIVEAFDFVGLMAVEMFLDQNNNVLVNEVAPRPHNSGHQSIEGNITSQYAQHLRSILNLPLGDTSVIQPSVMVNLLGDPDHSGPVHYQGLEEVLSIPGAYIHLYGKTHTKPWRKMGHVTLLGYDLNEANKKADVVKEKLKVVSEG
jgi:5-(carboxyamino)imidazole ribonucleotide synthase